MISTVDMDRQIKVQESLPFKSLEKLYETLENLTAWPNSVPLRQSTEYIYKGLDIHYRRSDLPKYNRDNLPRTLICHDMKGGYLEDRFIYGSKSHNAYTFYHWSVVDTFVYFSHHFITIPPYGWINVAHSHGVKILGTVITEGATNTIWTTILQSKENVERFANALIRIAKFYEFEGWLLNVENEIHKESIENLVYFVKYLSDRIHETVDNSEIIWYDSVTKEGLLKWQNELNEFNKDFFLNCDGIYLNYNWTDSKLASSCNFAKNLGRNVRDIYVGLDVWGRGCPGGGGFNSAYALEKIRNNGLSVAIFAPGWTHEYFGSKAFYNIEDLFWAQLFPFLYVHVPIYDNENFRTSFCRGSGTTYYSTGKAQQAATRFTVSAKRSALQVGPFYNLTMQNVQISVPAPLLRITNFTEEKSQFTEQEVNKSSQKPKTYIYETEKVFVRVCGSEINFQAKLPTPNTNFFEYCNDFSYEGGGCLRLITNNGSTYHRLFLLHLEFDEGVKATVVYKADTNFMIDEPQLVLKNNTGLKTIVPYESFDVANTAWRKCIYFSDVRTVHEIGVSFSRESNCYLGEIALEQRALKFQHLS